MTISLFERFERSEIELFHLNQIVDIGHVWQLYEHEMVMYSATSVSRSELFGEVWRQFAFDAIN